VRSRSTITATDPNYFHISIKEFVVKYFDLKRIEVEVAWLVVKSKLDSQQKYDTWTFSKVFRPPVGTNKSPILWVPGKFPPA